MGRGWGAVGVVAATCALGAAVPAHATSPYTLERLSVGLIGEDGKPAGVTRVRSTPDMSTIVIGSKGRLAGDEPAGDDDLDLFRVRDGGLERISPGLDATAQIESLSDDGRTVVLSNPSNLAAYEPYRLRDGVLTPLAPPAAMHGAGGIACASPDGERVVFTTSENLVPEDTTNGVDVYQWASGSLRWIGANIADLTAWGPPLLFVRCSADARTIAFRTREKLDPADTDGAYDVYVWREGVAGVERASRGDGGAGNATEVDAEFVFNAHTQISDDGTRVLFDTPERLGDGDADESHDLYVRSTGGLRRVTVGPTGGNGEGGVVTDDVAADPTLERVVFVTYERLVAADTDDAGDAYLRSGQTTTLLGPQPASGPVATPELTRATGDVSTVLLTTNERLTADDTEESALDLYRVSGDAAERIGRGGGLTIPTSSSELSHGFRNASLDLSAVVFETLARLDGDDTDGAYDEYVWRAGAAVPLVDPRTGPASQCGINANGSLILVCSTTRLTADDQGDTDDVFLAALPGAKRPPALGPAPPPGTKPPAAPPAGATVKPPTSARAAARLLVRMLRALGGRKLAAVRAFPFVVRLARTSRVEIKVRAGRRTVLSGRAGPEKGDIAVALRVPRAARSLLRTGRPRLQVEVKFAPRGRKVQRARAAMRLER